MGVLRIIEAKDLLGCGVPCSSSGARSRGPQAPAVEPRRRYSGPSAGAAGALEAGAPARTRSPCKTLPIAPRFGRGRLTTYVTPRREMELTTR
ncbi:hypothetical protein EVAR_65655_1 [Eumeta japonica]|uniref:Uncharacterized protein n=1 Tax=Eumeta variegata TaxID=151549 RepID=A0A4C1ZAC0_EUMVA|nr:hypothetical protein EVAR_65655_1 [Eumeta japonica]